ncbi:MAG: VCBS repeat-containing protein, partial [Candidatus Eisenbacteria bacterium]|nr:VCBS repeat-containing protein [Candidatus Eisenbacteria bacterium]
VLIGTGGGAFAPAAFYATGTGPRSLALGDLDGDQVLDVACTRLGLSQLSVLLGAGDGSFGPPSSLPTGLRPTDVAIGDLNGDGLADLVVTNRDSDDIHLFLGTAGRGFAPAEVFAAGDGPRAVWLADLDGNCSLDLAVALYGADGVAVLRCNRECPAQVEWADANLRSAQRISIAPNPLRSHTAIRFDLTRAGRTRVDILGIDGRRIDALLEGFRPAGPQRLEWRGVDGSGRPVPAGVYFLRVDAAGGRAVQRVIVAR